MRDLDPIHQTPEERQVTATRNTTEAVNAMGVKLDLLKETIEKAEKAKSEPINITVKLDLT